MEDVQYLQSHSRSDSHLAFIDSAARDTRTFPTASKFEVAFDTPFQMVYGIDLLGVNVPRTEYTVSSSRNQLVMSYGAPDQNQRHIVSMPEGDYDSLTFFSVLNAALSGFASASGNSLSVSALSALSSVTNKLQISCAEPFTLYMSSSSMRVVLGFSNPVNTSDGGYTAPGWTPGAPDTVMSMLSPQQGASLLAYDGSQGITGPPQPVLAFRQLEQVFVPSVTGMVVSVAAGFTSTGKPSQPFITWQVVSVADGSAVASGAVQVNLSSPVSTGSYTQAASVVTAGAPYRLVLLDNTNADASNCFNVSTRTTGPGYTVGGQAHGGSLAVTVQTQLPVSKVVAPGLLDLTGERYIILRCLEIESPVNKSRAFEKWTSGVGMIQLGTFGYTNNSYDYTAYPARTFDPIGNLSKLTLSFQKPDGTLYDFKGLNLQLQLLIKFLVPATPGPTHRANPQYTPLLPEAMSRRLQEEIAFDPRYRWMPKLPGRSVDDNLGMHGRQSFPGH